MQQPLACPTAGDKLPNFTLPDAAGTLRVFYNELRGGPILLAAFADLRETQQEAALGKLAEMAGGLAERGVEILALAANDGATVAATANRFGLTFPLFADPQRATLAPLLAAEPPVFPATTAVAPKACPEDRFRLAAASAIPNLWCDGFDSSARRTSSMTASPAPRVASILLHWASHTCSTVSSALSTRA